MDTREKARLRHRAFPFARKKAPARPEVTVRMTRKEVLKALSASLEAEGEESG